MLINFKEDPYCCTVDMWITAFMHIMKKALKSYPLHHPQFIHIEAFKIIVEKAIKADFRDLSTYPPLSTFCKI